MKNSIVNAEVKLNEKRSRLKKTKNDHKVAISKVKKELDNFNHRLRSGTDENRQKQRSLQLERTIRQTADVTTELDRQLSHLEVIPDDELDKWSSQKAYFESELQRLNSVKEDLVSAKSAVARELASLESEFQSTAQRRERLQSRRTRLNEQYERIVSANAQGLNERERRAAEQFAREQDHARLEVSFNEQFASFSQYIHEYQLRTNQLWQQASAIEQTIHQRRHQQQQQILMDSGPLTPEGDLPGTNPPHPEGASASTTAPSGRSLLGMSFASLKSSPLQSAASPVGAGSSQSASPAQPSYLQPVPSASYFSPDAIHRVRSFSNRSTLSNQFVSNAMDMNRMPSVQADPLEASADKRRSSGSDANSSLNMGFRPISSPFQRTGSHGSGSGSGGGSVSGSGSGSPSSARGRGSLA